MSKRGLLFGLVALLVSMSFAGCLGDEDADVDPNDGGATDGDDAAGNMTNETSPDDADLDDGPAPPVDNEEVDDAPQALFSVDLGNATNATAGLPIDFNASASNDPEGGNLTYAWDFGDGATGEGVALNHTFETAGNYTVTLTVTDEGGLTDTTNQTLAVVEGTPAAGELTTVSGSITLMNPACALIKTPPLEQRSLDQHKQLCGVEDTHWQVHTIEGVPEGINSLLFEAAYGDDTDAMQLAFKVFPEDGSAEVGSSPVPTGQVRVELEGDALGESTYHVFVYLGTGASIDYDLTVSYA